MYHHYFEPELLELRKEIDKHPALIERLTGQEEKDIYIQLCEISAYCGFLLDGFYTKDDILAICERCTAELRKKRVTIIS